jgi:hypothetical protein
MDTQQFQQLVSGQEEIKKELLALKQAVSNVSGRITIIDTRLRTIDTRLDLIEQRLAGMEPWLSVDHDHLKFNKEEEIV